MSIRDDVMAMRKAFWTFYYGRIPLAEMQKAVAEIMNKQLKLETIIENHRQASN